MSSLADVERWLVSKETEHLEFKEAKSGFGFDDVKRYVVALGNEGGGDLVLGISPKMPRRVVGSQAFRDVGELKFKLYQVFRRRFEIDEFQHPDGRIVVVHMPPRPLGVALHTDGAYLVRAGESVVPMTSDQLKAIFDEAGPDFSAETSDASLADLEGAAVVRMVDLWARKTSDENKRKLGANQALADLGLVVDGKVTNAALVLVGCAAALRTHLADAEIVYEYRAQEASITHDKRQEWRAPFLLIADEVWSAVDARNDIQHMQEGLFMRDIPTLREDVVREALLNAVCHRDYRQPGSVFLNQLPRKLIVSSPGGLPRGVTIENIVVQRHPRNRLLAEALQQLGLVERSGQGMDKMFRSSIEDGKLPPDFAGTDSDNVVVTLSGQVQDPRFLRYLERVGAAKLATFSAVDFIVLDHVRRAVDVPLRFRDRVERLLELGVIERASGKKLILSKGLYAHLGRKGEYTRAKGLDHETKKALLMTHLERDAGPGGASREELRQVLGPSTNAEHVKRLLRELKAEGRVRVEGRTKAARWFPSRGSRA